MRRELLAPIIEKLKTQARAGEPANIVEITGGVRLPGEYPLLASGDVRFLIQKPKVEDFFQKSKIDV